jgi:hypothetical protein
MHVCGAGMALALQPAPSRAVISYFVSVTPASMIFIVDDAALAAGVVCFAAAIIIQLIHLYLVVDMLAVERAIQT